MLFRSEGTLDQVELQWDRQVALGVVMAAHGYPADPRKGDAITGLPVVPSTPTSAQSVQVFHAGTQTGPQGEVLTSGGRVLCVTALGDSVRMAQHQAYEALAPIQFAGAQWRRDIGHRAVKPR